MAKFVVVPEWQGSRSARAMLLADGAHAIAGDLPRAACSVVDVPLEAGESLDTGVHRASSLLRIRESIERELTQIDDLVVVVGGDCGVAVPSVAQAAQRRPDLAVVWCDAHPDLHDPASSPSGAYGGMALSAILGDGAQGLRLPRGLVSRDRVIVVGARDIDAGEADRVEGLRRLDAAELSDPDALAELVAATGATGVYVHVDLDVLDPAEMSGVTDAVPFGARAADLVTAIARLRERIPLAGASLAGFAPQSPDAAVDDLGTILRLIGALA